MGGQLPSGHLRSTPYPYAGSLPEVLFCRLPYLSGPVWLREIVSIAYRILADFGAVVPLACPALAWLGEIA